MSSHPAGLSLVISSLSDRIIGRLRTWRPPTLSWSERLAVLVATGLWLYAVLAANPFGANIWSSAVDSHPYWVTSFPDIYAHSVVGNRDAYLYSPVFLQLLTPLRALPWLGFVAVWTLVLLGALFAISGRRRFLWILLFFGWWELISGNISFLLALALVAGFARPSFWAFPLLTKVTPGLGLVWFAARGQWRALLVVLVSVAAVVAISMALVGIGPWIDWVGTLFANNGVNITTDLYLPLGREIRFPLAIALGIYAARTDRRALMPLVVVLALPVIWWGGLSILLATPALYDSDRLRQVGGNDRLPLAVGRVSANLRTRWTARRLAVD